MTLSFLADVNVEKGLVDHIRASGYDIKWIPDYDRQMSDDMLLEMAVREKRILITNDKDFGELVFRQTRLGGVILLRFKGQQVLDKIKVLRKLLEDHSSRVSGSLCILSNEKIRIIPMENAS
jgi:predicted nuclease of predicted toxin-antitoxin system